MTRRHLRLVRANEGHRGAEPSPAERIRMAARRVALIGREMQAHAEELRSLTRPYRQDVPAVREAS